MQVTTKQAEKAMSGNHTFNQLGFSMLMWRLKRLYDEETTAETLGKCTEEINAFLQKYKSIMSADYGVLSSL